jgi:acetyl esterase/lipase
MIGAGLAVISSSLWANKKALAPEGIEVPKRSGRKMTLSSYHHLKNVIYKTADGQNLKMVLFLPPKAIEGPHPVMLYTHGGGWNSGDPFKVFNAPFKRSLDSLLANGVAVASIEYRLAKVGESSAYECAVDCMDAARFLMKHAEKFKLDPDKMGVWGGSAGGHLALLTGLADPRLFPGDEALAAFYPEFDVIASYYPATSLLEPEIVNDGILSEQWRINLILGGTIKEKPERARLLSPVTHLKQDSPPVLLLHGDSDPALPVSNSLHMVEVARKVGADVELLLVRNAGHVFKGKAINPSMEAINDRATEFILRKILKHAGPLDEPAPANGCRVPDGGTEERSDDMITRARTRSSGSSMATSG